MTWTYQTSFATFTLPYNLFSTALVSVFWIHATSFLLRKLLNAGAQLTQSLNFAKTLQNTGMPGQTGVIRGHLYQDMSSKLSTQPFCACWFSPSAVSHTFACQRHIGLALLRGLRGLPLLVLKRICERTSCLHQWRYTRFGVDATVCNWNQVQRPTVKSLDKAKQNSGMPRQTGVIRGHLYQDMSSKLSMQPLRARWFSRSAISHILSGLKRSTQQTNQIEPYSVEYPFGLSV